MDKIYLVVHLDYEDIRQWMVDTTSHYPDIDLDDLYVTLPVFRDSESEVMSQYLDVLTDQMQYEEMPRYAQVVKHAIEDEGYISNQLSAVSFTTLGSFLVLQLDNY